MKNLLMLHGWGFSSAVFNRLKNTLDSDFVVTAPDRPGYSLDAAKAVSEAPGSDEPISLSSPALVLGWSLGGIRAMQLALQQPEMVTGLVLLATTPCFVNRRGWSNGMDKAAFAAFQKQVKQEPASAMQQFVRLNSAAKPDRETREKLAGLSTDVAYSALNEGLNELEKTDMRDAVNSITVPVLLIHATDDRIVPVASSHWLHEHLVNSRLSEIAQGGHAFFIRHVAVIADHIREFDND